MIFAFARTPALPTVAGLRVELQVFVSEAIDYSTLSLPSTTSQKKIHFLASTAERCRRGSRRRRVHRLHHHLG
jgi:hypothetical protein